jgi:hypothetical protein
MKYVIAFAAFLQIAALYDMPSKCFTLAHFGTCERIQVEAWASRYTVNWESVDAVRTIGRE